MYRAVRPTGPHTSYWLYSICLQIHFHGINLGTLHAKIHKEVLPAELGGMEPPYNNQSWARQLTGDENFSFSDKHIYWPNQTQIT